LYTKTLQKLVTDLYASDDYNFDLNGIFPATDELISVTGFGKYILNPINEVTIASSTNDISFINTGDLDMLQVLK
jgi:hypothetical protein